MTFGREIKRMEITPLPCIFENLYLENEKLLCENFFVFDFFSSSPTTGVFFQIISESPCISNFLNIE
jgi:hypothetical protein